MFNKIRKAINDGVLYAMGVSDAQIAKDINKLLAKKPQYHSLHGILLPLIFRHHEIEKNSGKFPELENRMNALLAKANHKNEQQFSLLNFSIAAHSIALSRTTFLKTGLFDLETFEAFVTREWKSSYNFYNTSPQKTTLPSLIGCKIERANFLRSLGKLESPDHYDQLFFQKSQVISFALSKMQTTQSENSQFVEESAFWRWTFGEKNDDLFLSLKSELASLLNEVRFSNSVLLSDPNYNTNKDDNKAHDNSPSAITPCPSCARLLRFTLPINHAHGRCGTCKARFKISSNDQNKIILETAPLEKPSEKNNEVTAALSLLGLTGRPTTEQIKFAYRKKLSEYHPDKVNGLGEKLKQLAEDESKKINLAVETLKKFGHL